MFGNDRHQKRLFTHTNALCCVVQVNPKFIPSIVFSIDVIVCAQTDHCKKKLTPHFQVEIGRLDLLSVGVKKLNFRHQ